MVSLVALDEVQPWADTPDDVAVADARTHAQSTLDEGAQAAAGRLPDLLDDCARPHHRGGCDLARMARRRAIMVGSSRLAAPNTIFLGSTASKILRALAIPMIVVPGTTVD